MQDSHRRVSVKACNVEYVWYKAEQEKAIASMISKEERDYKAGIRAGGKGTKSGQKSSTGCVSGCLTAKKG